MECLFYSVTLVYLLQLFVFVVFFWILGRAYLLLHSAWRRTKDATKSINKGAFRAVPQLGSHRRNCHIRSRQQFVRLHHTPAQNILHRTISDSGTEPCRELGP